MSTLKKIFVNLIPPKVLKIMVCALSSFCLMVYVTNVHITWPMWLLPFVFAGIFAAERIILDNFGRIFKSAPSSLVILLSVAAAVLIIVVFRNVFFPTRGREVTYISLTAETAGEICLCDMTVDGESVPVGDASVVENSGWQYREEWDNFVIWLEEDGAENRLTLRFVADEVHLEFPYTPYAGSVTIESSAGRDGGTWDLRRPEPEEEEEEEEVQYADISFDCRHVYSPLELLMYGAGILPLMSFGCLMLFYVSALAWKQAD